MRRLREFINDEPGLFVLSTLLIALLLWVTYAYIVTHQISAGTIVRKSHTEEWTEMRTQHIGDVVTIIPVEHPERWLLHIEHDEKRGTLYPNFWVWQRFSVGDWVDESTMWDTEEPS